MLSVVFRCDASSQIGFGHLMRCLALAQRLRAEGDEVRFVTREDAGGARVLRAAGFSMVWLPATCSTEVAAEAFGRGVAGANVAGWPAWAVVDTYEQPLRYAAEARGAGGRVLKIDDLGGTPQEAEVLVNENLDADASWYPRANGTRLLLGGSYAILRQEFLEAPAREAAPSVERVLVTLGGSDGQNRTSLVLRGLQEAVRTRRQPFAADVIVGHGYAHRAELEALARTLAFRCTVHAGVERMAELMRQADLAITAAGTTVYETTCLGVPTLMLVLSENQIRNAEAFHRRGLAINLGQGSALVPDAIGQAVGRLLDDQTQRRAMSACGRVAIDGRGPGRIREALLAFGGRK